MENPRRAILFSVYFSFVQFLFMICWTVYVASLPELARSAGLPAGAVPWILLVDQAVFAISDLALGFAADRVRVEPGKFGPWIALMAAISCVAFFFLPFLGGMNSVFLLVLMLTWIVSSSVFRAPAFVFVMDGVARERLPWLSVISLFGVGLGSALIPIVGPGFREQDIRVSFAGASLVLLFAVVGLVRLKSRLLPATAVPSEKMPGRLSLFLLSALLISFGGQIQTFVSGPLQVAKIAAESADWLLPAYWAGFTLLAYPVLKLGIRSGAGLAAAALLGACGLAGAQYSGSAFLLAISHLVAGAGWGSFFALAIAWSIERGRPGREGIVLGAFFSMLSAAGFARILAVVLHFHQRPDWVGALQSAPLFFWVIGGLILLVTLPAVR